MKNKKPIQRILLGIFVFVGALLFLTGAYFIGKKQNLFAKTTTIYSVFNNVNGLQQGNNVRFAGVNVGIVKDLTIINDTTISVEMSIDDQTIKLIRKNSLADIGSDGLVGSMVINILPAEKKIAKSYYLKEGDTISSVNKITSSDMLKILNTTNENAAKLTEDLLKITKAINEGEGLLGVLIYDREMGSDIRKTVENFKTSSNLAVGTINKLNSELSEIQIKESVAGLLLKDTATARKVAGIIEKLEQSSVEIKSLTTEVNEFSRDLNDEDGVVNYIVKDSPLPAQLDQIIINIEQASQKLNENMEALKHNFLFRGYFRKMERQQRREERREERNRD